MIPDIYEGISLVSKDITNSKIIMGYFYKWAGVDADTPQKFSKMNGDNGVKFLGAIYSGFENIKLEGWIYNIEDIAVVTYFNATYDFNIKDIDISISGQYSNQDYDNGDNSKIYGVLIEVNYKDLG
ncbi:hypothetical protein MNB_SV-15-123 [hydrothermal vent metagenome]|uniref:Uncharacterized protein n=1 Tax=hydrothermal vent metagenome TaxID=652676 RepID=A0A1W1ELI7_9ZZZZ